MVKTKSLKNKKNITIIFCILLVLLLTFISQSALKADALKTVFELTKALLSTAASGGADTSAILDVFDKSDSLITNSNETILNSTCAWIYEVLFGSVIGIMDYFSASFAPGMSEFFSFFGVTGKSIGYNETFNFIELVKGAFGNTAAATQSKVLSGQNLIINFVGVSTILGFALATVLFLVNLLSFLMARTIETTETPLQAIMKYIVACILVAGGPSLLGLLFPMMSYTYTLVTFGVGDAHLGSTLGNFITRCSNALFDGDWGIITFIVSIILGFTVLRELFKLIVEIVERYLWSCVMMLIAPMFFASVSSKKTSKVLSSYVTMYFCQLFLLLINQLFLRGAYILMSFWDSNSNAGVSVCFAQFCALLAWLRIGQKMDDFLNRLGLNVANTGGSVLDAVYAATRAISGAIKTGIGVTGKATEAVGLKSNSSEAVAFGRLLQGNLTGAANAKSEMQNKGIDLAKTKFSSNEASSVANGKGNNVAAAAFNNDKAGAIDTMFGSSTFSSGVKTDNGTKTSAQRDIGEKIFGKGFKLDYANSSYNPSNNTFSFAGVGPNGEEMSATVAKDGLGLKNSQRYISGYEGSKWGIQYNDKYSTDALKDGQSMDAKTALRMSGMKDSDLKKYAADGFIDAKTGKLNATTASRNGKTIDFFDKSGQIVGTMDYSYMANGSPDYRPVKTRVSLKGETLEKPAVENEAFRARYAATNDATDIVVKMNPDGTGGYINSREMKPNGKYMNASHDFRIVSQGELKLGPNEKYYNMGNNGGGIVVNKSNRRMKKEENDIIPIVPPDRPPIG